MESSEFHIKTRRRRDHKMETSWSNIFLVHCLVNCVDMDSIATRWISNDSRRSNNNLQ